MATCSSPRRAAPHEIGDDIAGLGEDAFGGDNKVEFLQNEWSVSLSLISWPG